MPPRSVRILPAREVVPRNDGKKPSRDWHISRNGPSTLAASLVLTAELDGWTGSLFEQMPTGFAITAIALDVRGRVPGIDDARFAQAAERPRGSAQSRRRPTVIARTSNFTALAQ